MINHNNIEAYIIDFVQQDLTADESQALMDFIKSHPEYETLLEEYQQTVLPEEIVVYEDKAQLLQPIAATKKRLYIWPIAAGVLAIIGLFGFWQIFQNDENPVTQETTDNSIATHTTIDSNTAIAPQPQTQTTNTTVVSKANIATILPTKHKTKQLAIAVKNDGNKSNNESTYQDFSKKEIQNINALAMAPTKRNEVNIAIDMNYVKVIPVTNSYQKLEEELPILKNNLLLDEDKSESLALLKEEITKQKENFKKQAMAYLDDDISIFNRKINFKNNKKQ